MATTPDCESDKSGTTLSLITAVIYTISAIAQWYLVTEFVILQRSYSPQILTAIHFHWPRYLVLFAILTTLGAASAWVRTIRRTEW